MAASPQVKNPKAGASLLEEAIAAHGGMSTWKKYKFATYNINLSGQYLAHKGFPSNYHPEVKVSTTSARTEFTGLDLERPSDIWVFTPDRVWRQDSSGTELQTRSAPRAAFDTHTRDTKWDQLHLAYFFGYAIQNYTGYPFIFAEPGFSYQELEEHWEPGYVNSASIPESWRVLQVEFPENYPAHTRSQKFYFDREKLWIRRMDYVTDVARGVAAHYVFDHRVFKGIVVPTMRRVVGRDPETGVAAVHGPTSFLLSYFDVDFQE
ncbi:uncharacterized protein LY89DRAFT_22746 [Mollisia scopiformis]|uniref:Uncharacterized protein n=1 Tax=Mollisia scopiformis TaxID=149040 RepID=A0A194XXC7_MOLSC|nr:uncharacterized protein LY89DRAFT_22746 [Mollisia scopiformis]KUJ24442.1 hypothetical protein LY89DRAFT_22746 [Mollisia scopiformis]